MTLILTFKFDLDIPPLDLHAKSQDCMSVPSAVRARQTHSQTMPKLLQTLLTQGVMITAYFSHPVCQSPMVTVAQNPYLTMKMKHTHTQNVEGSVKKMHFTVNVNAWMHLCLVTL